MTLSKYNELVEYWCNYPPVHLLVAGYLGIERKHKPPETFEGLITEWGSVPGLKIGRGGGSFAL